MVEAAVAAIHDAMGAHATAIFRVGDDNIVELAAGAGALAGMQGYTQPLERGLVGRCLREGGVVLAADVKREPDYATTAATGDIRSELDVPLVVHGRRWGAVSVQSTELDAYDESDAGMLRGAAHHLSAALRSAQLHEQLDRAQVGAAEALRAALDARAAASAETPALVQRCEAVGRRLELPEAELTALRLAAALHDIGELGVPEAILNKPGPLTEDERPAVERTPLIGEGILSPVEFLLGDAVPLVRAGHERWDGTGYPDGLAGDLIPLGARILFACDAYEAMTAERPYRRAMRPEDAEVELLRVAGTQLDPRVVEALLWVLHSGS
jgi:response regulator RpfG family c-di-GMP phosphodiesterase